MNSPPRDQGEEYQRSNSRSQPRPSSSRRISFPEDQMSDPIFDDFRKRDWPDYEGSNQQPVAPPKVRDILYSLKGLTRNLNGEKALAVGLLISILVYLNGATALGIPKQDIVAAWIVVAFLAVLIVINYMFKDYTSIRSHYHLATKVDSLERYYNIRKGILIYWLYPIIAFNTLLLVMIFVSIFILPQDKDRSKNRDNVPHPDTLTPVHHFYLLLQYAIGVGLILLALMIRKTQKNIFYAEESAQLSLNSRPLIQP